MIPPLTSEDFTLLRAALQGRRCHYEQLSTLAAQLCQGTEKTRVLVDIGGRIRHIDALDAQLRDEHARLTGQPDIVRGNADIADCSSPAWPMSREDQAREANTRG